MTRNKVLIALALVVVASALVISSARPKTELQPAVQPMPGHGQKVDTIRRSIIAIDLAAVRETGASLADYAAQPDWSPAWARFANQLHEYAQGIARSPNLVSSAHATSELALACANCHRANRVSIEFGPLKPPSEDAQDVASHMQRHQWAADRLWEGLIGPSDRAWYAGADLLLRVPLEGEDFEGAPRNEKGELARMALEVHLIGSRGAAAHEPDRRSELYAEYLTLCVDCHTTLERGPRQ